MSWGAACTGCASLRPSPSTNAAYQHECGSIKAPPITSALTLRVQDCPGVFYPTPSISIQGGTTYLLLHLLRYAYRGKPLFQRLLNPSVYRVPWLRRTSAKLVLEELPVLLRAHRTFRGLAIRVITRCQPCLQMSAPRFSRPSLADDGVSTSTGTRGFGCEEAGRVTEPSSPHRFRSN